MPIRCPKCGYSNDAEFRFCGMCGAALNRPYEEPIRSKPAPPPERSSAATASAADPAWASQGRRTYTEERPLPRIDSTAKREYSPVNGPSFLGLDPTGASSEPTPQYLLEDDEPSGHGRLFLALFLLLAVGGGLFWQWQHEGYPWNPAPKQTTSSISGEATDASAPPSTADAAQPAGSPNPAPAKPDPSSVAEDKAAPPPPAAKEEKKDDASSQAQPSEDKAESEPAPKPAKAAVAPAAAKAKRGIREPAPEPADDPDPSEALFVDGQKYLYGSGVAEDCGRARTKLMAAANQSNSKAQSTVATMYATGHCLPRSLPSAYHWFAVALHNDRDNGRLQRDLEVIWSQMTAEEKEIALKSR